MKAKSVTILSALALVAVASAATANSGSISVLRSDLTLRPGVALSGHPRIVPSRYFGALNATYNPSTSRFFFRLEYKGLAGSVFRVEIRSRHSGAVYAVLCSPCAPVSAGRGHEGLPVRKLAGTVSIGSDVGYLIAGDRTFVEADTTAYPAGEIGGPILLHVALSLPTGNGNGGPFSPPPPRETPRCC